MPRRIQGVLALFFVFALAFDASEAQAQTLNVGYTDHAVIIAAMPEYRQVRQQLQGEYEGGQGELQGLVQEYQEKLEKYQKQQALLSEERRAEREQELLALQQQIQQGAATKEQELAQREIELMAPLFDKVQDAIDAVAQEQGLDLVLRTEAGPTAPIILYVNPDRIVDITPDVARRLGLDVEVEETATN